MEQLVLLTRVMAVEIVLELQVIMQQEVEVALARLVLLLPT
jgi:hypothetical protein